MGTDLDDLNAGRDYEKSMSEYLARIDSIDLSMAEQIKVRPFGLEMIMFDRLRSAAKNLDESISAVDAFWFLADKSGLSAGMFLSIIQLPAGEKLSREMFGRAVFEGTGQNKDVVNDFLLGINPDIRIFFNKLKAFFSDRNLRIQKKEFENFLESEGISAKDIKDLFYSNVWAYVGGELKKIEDPEVLSRLRRKTNLFDE
jgi:hypothetical protein